MFKFFKKTNLTVEVISMNSRDYKILSKDYRKIKDKKSISTQYSANWESGNFIDDSKKCCCCFKLK